jgi:hypothetical protein
MTTVAFGVFQYQYEPGGVCQIPIALVMREARSRPYPPFALSRRPQTDVPKLLRKVFLSHRARVALFIRDHSDDSLGALLHVCAGFRRRFDTE